MADFCDIKIEAPKRFTKQISFIAFESASDGMGGVIVTPSVYMTTWADVIEARAKEDENSDKIRHRVLYHVFIRNRSGILPTMQILYNDRYLEILSITAKGDRLQYLYLTATEAEATGTPEPLPVLDVDDGAVSFWDGDSAKYAFGGLNWNEASGILRNMNTGDVYATEDYVDAAIAAIPGGGGGTWGSITGTLADQTDLSGALAAKLDASKVPDGTVVGQLAYWDGVKLHWLPSSCAAAGGACSFGSGSPSSSQLNSVSNVFPQIRWANISESIFGHVFCDSFGYSNFYSSGYRFNFDGHLMPKGSSGGRIGLVHTGQTTQYSLMSFINNLRIGRSSDGSSPYAFDFTLRSDGVFLIGNDAVAYFEAAGADLGYYKKTSLMRRMAKNTANWIEPTDAIRRSQLKTQMEGYAGTADVIVLESDGTEAGSSAAFNAATVMMPNLPTVDPANAGQLWNDGGTLKISLG